MYVDSGAPLEPLLAAVERVGRHAGRTCCARTGTRDHVEHEDELGLSVVTGDFETGGLRVEALPTPGHSDDGVCLRRQRRALLLRRHAVQGRRRRHARRLRRREALGHGRADGAPARDSRAAGPHGRDDDRPRVGAEPVRPGLARRRPRGHRGVQRRRRARRRWSSGRPTTTARARPGFASPTARDAIVGGSRVERG